MAVYPFLALHILRPKRSISPDLVLGYLRPKSGITPDLDLVDLVMKLMRSTPPTLLAEMLLLTINLDLSH